MNGAGNAFVIFDGRRENLGLTPAQIKDIADPAKGAGPVDQVIAMEATLRGDVFMRIWNADGEEVSACGNGTRAVAWLLMQEHGGAKEIDTAAGLLHAEPRGGDRIMVDMGAPRLDWREIPVARATDTVRMDYAIDVGGVRLAAPGGVWTTGTPASIAVPATDSARAASTALRVRRFRARAAYRRCSAAARPRCSRGRSSRGT